MRTFCLLLILVNALYFVWSQFVDIRVSSLDRVPARTAPLPPRIVLATEATDEEREGAARQAPVRDIVPPRVAPLSATTDSQRSEVARVDGLACTSVGPFADLSQASQAQATLRAAGYEPRQRVEDGELWTGYWVSVRDLPTRDAAERALQRLRDSGITDVYMMPGSDPNVLSLGVFSDYERAQRRTDQVRALGLVPEISDRTRAGSVFWIDVDLKEPGEQLDTSIFQVGQSRILRLEVRACPAQSSGGVG